MSSIQIQQSPWNKVKEIIILIITILYAIMGYNIIYTMDIQIASITVLRIKLVVHVRSKIIFTKSQKINLLLWKVLHRIGQYMDIHLIS